MTTPLLAAAPPTSAPAVPSSTRIFAIQLTADVRKAPAQIALKWPRNEWAGAVDVMRRTPDQRKWAKLTTRPLAEGATQYVDNDVAVGKPYEYAVVSAKPHPATLGRGASGYLCSGIEVPMVEARGKVVLLVEARAAKALAKELAMVQYDLAGDGWEVLRHDVAADLPAPKVKELIQKDYETDKEHVRAVYIFGHVAVPYSGAIVPDGHGDHFGAWPADGYYGDMDGQWTDTRAKTPDDTNPRQKNVPGDGKFDQGQFPSDLELEVGRVDFANIGGFGKTEIELLAAYVRKSHAYRTGRRTYTPQALIDDNFGHFAGHAFAATGWRSFPGIVGGRIRELQGNETGQLPAVTSEQDWLFVYACAPSGPYSMGSVVSMDDMRKAPMRAPFWILFGSYFGDFDHTDSILRGPLAGSDGLSNCWSGFPLWFFHPMGMGQTLGHCARLSMNNRPGSLDYTMSKDAGGVHMALMGDPTLRICSIAAPVNVTAQPLGSKVLVKWTAAADKALGYHVYRADQPAGPVARVTTEAVKVAAWQDAVPSKSKDVTYMVRATKLVTTPSGSYFDLGQGAFDNGGKRGSE